MADPNVKIITLTGAAAAGADPKPKTQKLTFKVVHHVSFTKEEFLARFGDDKTPEQKEKLWADVRVAYVGERKDGVVEVEHADFDAAEEAAKEAVEQWISDYA
jgi:hypothetical protein